MMTRGQVYGTACVLVFAGMLVACLWPFRAPQNQVTWLEQGDGLHFGSYGTIASRRALLPSVTPASDWTLELWLQPGKSYQRGTILALYSPDTPRGFSLRQWDSALVAEDRLWSRDDVRLGEQAVSVAGIFRRRQLIFVAIVCGADGTSLYVDGNLAQLAPQLKVSGAEMSGQLVLGNSPVNNEGWSGDVRGLSIYRGGASAADILHDYETWGNPGRPASAQNVSVAALYLFDEHTGAIVHNQVSSGADLYIPSRYIEVHEAFLKRPWNEYHPDADYWKNIAINIAGFIPLGFLLYGYLCLGKRVRRAAIMTVLSGALLSLAVEILQSFLPTRDSGMTDIITNTLGTAIGVAVLRYATQTSRYLEDSRHRIVRLFAGLFTPYSREPANVMETPEYTGNSRK